MSQELKRWAEEVLGEDPHDLELLKHRNRMEKKLNKEKDKKFREMEKRMYNIEDEEIW